MSARSTLTHNQPGSGEGWRALMAGVLWQAAMEVQAGDPQAQAWMLESGPAFADALGLEADPDWWAAWVASGCPRHRKQFQH